MPISRRLRFEILRRDSHTCRYCGRSAPDVTLSVDHVIPTALGGGDDPTNLVTACTECNAGKSSIQPDAELVTDVAADAQRFAAALERASEQRRQEIRSMQTHVDHFDTVWLNWTWTDTAGEKHHVERPNDWPLSIERFIILGLDNDDLDGLVHSTMIKRYLRDEWRYFRGSAWGEINRRQEIARRSLDGGDDATTESPEYDRGYDDGFADGAGYVRGQADDAYGRGVRDGIATGRAGDADERVEGE